MSQPVFPTLKDLSEPELALLHAAQAGDRIDLKGQTVRGSVVRELISGARPGWGIAPSGLRLSRAVVADGLDIEGCAAAVPLLFWNVTFQAGRRGAILARDARLKRLGLHGCIVEGPIIADRVQIENGLFVGGGSVDGVVMVRGAEIGGALALEGTSLGDGRQAFLAAGLRLQGPLYLRKGKLRGDVGLARAQLAGGVYAEEAEILGMDIAINAESAKIDGDFLIEAATVSAPAGVGICLANARVTGRLAAPRIKLTGKSEALKAGGLNVGQGMCLTAAVLSGAALLPGASIGKSFETEGIEVDGGGTAIIADGISIGGNWDLARSKLVGQLSCPGADIRGQLRLTEGRLFGSDLAIRADGSRIRGGLYMSRAMVFGLLRFPACEVGNQFRLRGASLKVDAGAALMANGTRFGRDVQLNDGFRTIGAVVLDQARIPGVLDLSGSAIKSAALARDGRQGAAGKPAVGGGVPAARPALMVRHDQEDWDEIVLSLVDAEVNRMQMPALADERPRGIVDLSRLRAGAFSDFAAAWPPAPRARGLSGDGRDIDHLVLDGFTYEHLANPAGVSGQADHDHRQNDAVAERRLVWLEGQEAADIQEHFKPQPWVQLGARLAAQGYHEDARAILIARRRFELGSSAVRASQRWQGRFLDVFALYGYNPWRTVAWMAVFVVLFAGLWAWAGAHCQREGCRDETVFVVANRDAYNPDRFDAVYPAFNPLAYSFDVFVPFVSFGYADHWRPNVDWQPLAEVSLPIGLGAAGAERHVVRITLGGVLYVLVICEMLIGIVLTSLLVTGFTGLLRSE